MALKGHILFAGLQSFFQGIAKTDMVKHWNNRELQVSRMTTLTDRAGHKIIDFSNMPADRSVGVNAQIPVVTRDWKVRRSADDYYNVMLDYVAGAANNSRQLAQRAGVDALSAAVAVFMRSSGDRKYRRPTTWLHHKIISRANLVMTVPTTGASCQVYSLADYSTGVTNFTLDQNKPALLISTQAVSPDNIIPLLATHYDFAANPGEYYLVDISGPTKNYTLESNIGTLHDGDIENYLFATNSASDYALNNFLCPGAGYSHYYLIGITTSSDTNATLVLPEYSFVDHLTELYPVMAYRARSRSLINISVVVAEAMIFRALFFNLVNMNYLDSPSNESFNSNVDVSEYHNRASINVIVTPNFLAPVLYPVVPLELSALFGLTTSFVDDHFVERWSKTATSVPRKRGFYRSMYFDGTDATYLSPLDAAGAGYNLMTSVGVSAVPVALWNNQTIVGNYGMGLSNGSLPPVRNNLIIEQLASESDNLNSGTTYEPLSRE